MAQRLKQQETIPENIKRIILEQLERAIDRLSSKTGSKDQAIHDARVCFKKVRAMLRLVRFEIGETTFKKENTFYRDAGRKLAALRDTVVAADTLKKLVGDLAEHYAATDLKSLRKRLMSSRTDLRLDRKEVVQELAKTLESTRERVKGFALSLDSFSAVGPGLRSVYCKGRNSFATVYNEPSSENLHEWRKQVKYLGYQTGVLNPIWPNMLDVHTSELNRLSDYLSEDHDLVLLETRVLEQAESSSQVEDGESLLPVIALRREHIQKKALALGVRLYAEKPKNFAARFQTYWEEWRPAGVTNDTEASSETVACSQPGEAGQPSSSERADAMASVAGEPGG